MFYEVIYTRCRHGIDIQHNGTPITHDGYKVYASSPEIYQSGEYDLKYMMELLKSKQYYSDPKFMDDAYLYCMDGKEKTFMMNFHPIHFDPTVEGDFVKRPGNFLNNILAGDFSDIYPFELFEDTEVWKAKENDEAYYYANEPQELSPREDIVDLPGMISVDEIREFIKDGREEVLKSAVAFLIEQYSSRALNKVLMIKEDSTRNIELWIAAIEYAFSPKIASGIPFATRVDVKTQSMYKVMIIGVHTEDKNNVNYARQLTSSPFVLVDGISKAINFDTDISSRYYNLITSYEDAHVNFVREFLQTFNLRQPQAEIIELAEFFDTACKGESMSDDEIVALVEQFNKYGFSKTRFLIKVYNIVNSRLQKLMKLDLNSATSIITWVQSAASIIRDQDTAERINAAITTLFDKTAFQKTTVESAHNIWAMAKKNNLSNALAPLLLDINNLKKNELKMHGFMPEETLTFLRMYLDASGESGQVNEEHLQWLVGVLSEVLYSSSSHENMCALVKEIYSLKKVNPAGILLNAAANSNKDVSATIVKGLLGSGCFAARNMSELNDICMSFNKQGMEASVPSVLEQYIEKNCNTSNMEQFMKQLVGLEQLSQDAIDSIYVSFDKKINILNKADSKPAKFIQSSKPEGLSCIFSAHQLALDFVSNIGKRDDLKNSLDYFVAQGFPVIENRVYAEGFADALTRAKLDENEHYYIMNILAKGPALYFDVYAGKVCAMASKYDERWCEILDFCVAARAKSVQSLVYGSIVKAIAGTDQSRKTLKILTKPIDSGKAMALLDSAIKEAGIMGNSETKNQTSTLGGLFRRK